MVADAVIANLVAQLSNYSAAESPLAFPRDPLAAAQPGLSRWWSDIDGRTALAEPLGTPLPALIYAGLAGATKWPSAKEGKATLFTRIRLMHLQGNIEFSTFRSTLAALLWHHLGLCLSRPKRLDAQSEQRLTTWMNQHLCVVSVPYPDRGTLGRAEHEILQRLDPPLNLMDMPTSPIRMDMPTSPIRIRLSELRRKLVRSLPATMDDPVDYPEPTNLVPERAVAGAAIAGTLVIVPCGLRKIWDDHPEHGPAQARDAYVSPYFKKNRAYAEEVGSRWVVLSAKYGFMPPEFQIPGTYNVTFKDRHSNPISPADLARQVLAQGRGGFHEIVGLGGKDYRELLEPAFAGSGAKIVSRSWACGSA